jgi:hypothetical protein
MPLDYADFQCNTDSPRPTFDAPMPDGQWLHIEKMDEDPDRGYCYKIGVLDRAKLNNHVVGEGWFDGFGCEDRAHDVIHFLRAFQHAFHRGW